MGLIPHCGMCSVAEKPKLKSGTYAKSNINIKVQEQWPHMNVLRKYCKRTTFEQLEFDAFVAGEIKIILGLNSVAEMRGRLDFLLKISHWLCRSKDWPLVKGLYEAVLESIEMGEETWFSDFSHYGSMVPGVAKQDNRGEVKLRSKEKTEVFWCKMYQRINCQETSPHMAQVKPDEPLVPVIHCCALCLQRDGKRNDHPESECPTRK